jgi:FlaA1/EpsC-like NDP-sugar epimerase
MELNPSESILNNVLGSKNLADLAVEFKVKKFVMISTDKAVNPTNIMGATKRIAEIYIQSLNKTTNTQFITTRFGNVLGSNGSVIPRFKRQLEKGEPLTVTHPDITRYFMTISEACQLVLEASAMGKGGEIFIFDMGQSVKIAELAKKMILLSGLELGKDIQIIYTGLRPGEKLYEELLANEENTIPTHHSKIMIARVKEYDFDVISHEINDLILMFEGQDNDTIVRKMKDIVPEFVSQNSVFEKLDYR